MGWVDAPTGWELISDPKTIPYKEDPYSDNDLGMRFLKTFSSALDQRNKNTERAMKGTGMDDSLYDVNLGASGPIGGGAFQVAPGIAVQPGYRGEEFTIAGTPGQKGWGSTIGTIGGGLIGGPVGATIGGSVGGMFG